MIADCETCDRKQVPCKSCQESQRAICYRCDGDVDDPYAELADALDYAHTMHKAKDILTEQLKNATWQAKAEAALVLAEEIKRRKAAVECLKAFVQYESWMDSHGDDAQVSTFKRHTFGDLRQAMEIINHGD